MEIASIISKGNAYGKLIMLLGIIVMCPVLMIPFFSEEAPYAIAFVAPGFLSIALGMVICLAFPSNKRRRPAKWKSNLSRGSLIVLFIWCYAFIIGAIPFFACSQLSPFLSLFESVSGWTTTGLTVADIDSLPHIFLFHRSFMQYCGGIGFVIMFSMIIQSKDAASLYNAEGHHDMLKPSFKGTAYTIGKIYITCLLVGTAAYWILGMNLFDALCHTMSALSTAGFSTKSASIGAFSNAGIDIVTIILMLIGASNFVIVQMIMNLKIKTAFKDSEFRFMIIVMTIATLLVCFNLMGDRDLPFGQALLRACFGVVATFSTTGYNIEDCTLWPPFSLGIVFILMVIGGSSGSTAGGIKMSRAYFLLRNMVDYVRRQVTSPRRITKSEYIKNDYTISINPRIQNNASGFVSLYILFLICGVLTLTLSENCSLIDAAFEFTSALGTVGLSCGITSPDASVLTLSVEMIAMVLGRLEILMVLVGIKELIDNIAGIRFKKTA